jgi:AcrR family transcriptional regulator
VGKIARREDIRDLILDATDFLLAHFGYKKMTMEDVAKQVGIGKGTVYLHFPSKQELVLAHIDRIVERVLVTIREIAGSSETADRRIRRMLVSRVLVRFGSVVHYSHSLSDLLSQVRTDLLARRKAYFEKEAAVFEEVLREGVRDGALECADPRTTSFVLIEATNSLLPFNLSAQELGRREEVEAQAGRIADLLVKGLLACPSRPAHWTR